MIPNLISISRIIIGFYIFYFAYYYNDLNSYFLFLLCVIASASDYFDGYLARLWNQKTKVGLYLDPLADKIFITLIFIALYLIKSIPFYFLIIILGRDILILLGSAILLIKKTEIISPIILSKINSTIQYACALLLVGLSSLKLKSLFYPIDNIIIYITIITTITSGLIYFKMFLQKITKAKF